MIASDTPTMASIEFDSRRLSWNGKGATGWFRPNGSLRSVGNVAHLRPNPENWSSDEPVLGARIITGFNVGETPTWTISDMIDLVKERRLQQVGDPGATFLAQRGLFAHRDKKGDITNIVEEDGAQVIILNVPPADRPAATFRKDMLALAEEMAETFRQQEVILEFQKGGLHERTVGVGPITPLD